MKKLATYILDTTKCASEMRVIAFIHDEEVIRKILKHLNLWDVKPKLTPRAHHAPPIDDFPAYDDQQGPNVDDYIKDPDYPAEAYF